MNQLYRRALNLSCTRATNNLIPLCYLEIHYIYGCEYVTADSLLPGISKQQTIFLSDLRFLVRWCSISKCLAAAPVFLFRATRHFVLFSCEFKICAEVVVHRMFAVFLNSLNVVQELLYGTFFRFFYARFQD